MASLPDFRGKSRPTSYGVSGGVSGIKNVIGGAGNFNILVGNGGDILTGGNGRRNLLIAGATAFGSTLVRLRRAHANYSSHWFLI